MQEKDNKKTDNSLANLMNYITYRRKRQKTLQRASKKVSEYILSNNFDLYVTITFDPRRLRNYNPQAAFSRLNGWFARQRQNSREVGKEFRYITFPEVYRDKSIIEFHVLMTGWDFNLVRSGIVVDGTLALTISHFKFGYTKARSLQDYSKQQIFEMVLPHLERNSTDFFNGRSYYPSRNLEVIEVIHNAETRMDVATTLDPINALGAYSVETMEALGLGTDYKPVKGHKRLLDN